jgi:hypothetical protein
MEIALSLYYPITKNWLKTYFFLMIKGSFSTIILQVLIVVGMTSVIIREFYDTCTLLIFLIYHTYLILIVVEHIALFNMYFIIIDERFRLGRYGAYKKNIYHKITCYRNKEKDG